MSIPIAMPKQGQTVESCVLLEWIKKKGDRINQGDTLFTYETDKATFEFESPASGILLETFFNPQDDVPVHTVVAVIGEPGENIESFQLKHTKPSDEPVKTTAASPPLVATTPSSLPSPSSNIPPSKPGVSSPRARKKAIERGVDLSTVAGTGPHGRVIERDVLAKPALTPTAASRRIKEGLSIPADSVISGSRIRSDELLDSAKESSVLPIDDTVARISLTNIRKIIGSRMMQSLQQTAQLTMNAYADASTLLSYRAQTKARGKEDITITDLIAFAVAHTLPQFQELNGIFRDDMFYKYAHVHLAVAVDTPRGLMVPVVRFADQLSLPVLSASLKDLATQCRDGSINPDYLSGGTITISNLGIFGIDSFTPILNPPQVAILGVNAIAPRPVQTENGEYTIRQQIGFSLTIDHSIVDGAPAARFLKTLCDHIAHIDFMLTTW